MLYRNLLAMETEEILRSYPADGCVLMGGCDKTTPALLMGAISHGPADDLSARRPDAARQLERRRRSAAAPTPGSTGPSCARATSREEDWTGIERRHRALAGPLHDDGHRVDDDERRRSARASRCRASSSIPAPDSRHAQMASLTGRRIVEMVWEDLKPSDILERVVVRQRGHDGARARRVDATPSCT